MKTLTYTVVSRQDITSGIGLSEALETLETQTKNGVAFVDGEVFADLWNRCHPSQHHRIRLGAGQSFRVCVLDGNAGPMLVMEAREYQEGGYGVLEISRRPHVPCYHGGRLR